MNIPWGSLGSAFADSKALGVPWSELLWPLSYRPLLGNRCRVGLSLTGREAGTTKAVTAGSFSGSWEGT